MKTFFFNIFQMSWARFSKHANLKLKNKPLEKLYVAFFTTALWMGHGGVIFSRCSVCVSLFQLFGIVRETITT